MLRLDDMIEISGNFFNSFILEILEVSLEYNWDFELKTPEEMSKCWALLSV